MEKNTDISSAPGRRVIIIWLAVILLAGILVYLPSLDGDWCLDDDMVIVSNPVAHGLQNIPQAFTSHFLFGFQGAESLYYRPLITISYQLDYSLFGLDPLFFRITNLILYVICTALFFALAWKLTRNIHVAGIAGLAFALMPSHSESVSWISGRTDLIAAIFVIASTLLFVMNCERKDGFSWKLAGSSTLLLLAGLLSKEIAIITPVLFVLYAWVYGKRLERNVVLKWVALLIPTLAFYFVLRLSVLGNTFSGQADHMVMSRLIKVGLAYAIYLWMLFVPREPLIFYNLYTIKAADHMPLVLTAWLAPAALVMLAIWGRKRLPVLAYGAAWVFIGLMLHTELVPANGLLKPCERFTFMASIGSSFMLGWLFWKLYEYRPKSIQIWPVVVVVLISGYMLYSSAMSVLGARINQSDITWAQYVVEQKPNNWIFHASAAQFFSRAGEIEAAASEYEAAICCGRMERKEDEALTAFKLGVLYIDTGNVDGALRNFQRTVKADPRHGEAWRKLGLIWLVQGQHAKAASAYEKAVKLVEFTELDHLCLGRAYKGLGKKEKAIREFKSALAVDPESRYARDAQKELSMLASTSKRP